MRPDLLSSSQPVTTARRAALKCDLREDPQVRRRLAERREQPTTYEQVRPVSHPPPDGYDSPLTPVTHRAWRWRGGYERRATSRCAPHLPTGSQSALSIRRPQCSAKANRGVVEAFTEAAHVAVGARARGTTRGSAKDDRPPEERAKGCLSWCMPS